MKKTAGKKDMPIKDRHLGVILEDINSKFDFLVDGHTALDKNINDFHEEFIDFRNEANWKFKQILEELREFKEGRVVELEKRLGRLEKWASSRN